MARGRFDRHAIGLVLQMNRERFTERHLGRRMICHRALLAQKFGKSRFRDGQMIGAQAFPNFFIVAERAGIVAAGFMTHEVLHLGFLPRFVRSFARAVFHRFASACTVTVENTKKSFQRTSFPS